MTDHELYHLIRAVEGRNAHEAASNVRRFTPHVEITLGIDKDHTASLTMDRETFAVLQRKASTIDMAAAEADRTEALSFGEAIAALKADNRVQREGWNGRGMHLWLQRPDEHSLMTLPYIAMLTVTGDRVPWLASQTDMLSNDWRITE